MKRFISDQPAIVRYVIVALISSVMAVLFYFVGGSLADVSNNSSTLYGVGFKAGGSLGGFVIVFLLSIMAIGQLSKGVPSAQTPFEVRLRVKAQDQQFKEGVTYNATATIKRVPSNEEDSVKTDPWWDGDGSLAMNLSPVFPRDQIAVVIESEDSRKWKVSGFLVSERSQDARFMGPGASAARRGQVVQGPAAGPSVQVEQKPSGSSRPHATTGGRRTGVGPVANDATGTPKK